MVGSHEGEPCRLFDQAIYTYLISCRVGSGFRVGLSGQASQPDPTLFQKNSNPTRHFSGRVLDPNSGTRPDAVSLIERSVERSVGSSLDDLVERSVERSAGVLDRET